MEITVSKIEYKSHYGYVSKFAIVFLFTAFFHHFFLCFVNTNLVSVSSAWLILTELFFVGTTSILLIRQATLGYILILLFIFTNVFVLAIFQQFFDPKTLRNFLLPVLLIWLGSKYDNNYSADKIVLHAGLLVLVVGLFELSFSETFQQFFNVLNFQVSTGRLTENSTQYAETTFSLNGTRFGGRNTLSFLGDHRVSSVFLDTVTVSNFATILVAWGLSKQSVKSSLHYVALGFSIALLADSRFALTLIVLMVFLRLVFTRDLLKYTAYFMPVFVISICIWFGLEFTQFDDDFKTRLGITGHYLLNLTPLEIFGLSSHHYAKFLDQGYVKLLHYNGVILGVAFWVVFCRLQVVKQAEIFKYLAAVIISANLAISGDSIFSFKWASLMWFLIGVSTVSRQKALTT